LLAKISGSNKSIEILQIFFHGEILTPSHSYSTRLTVMNT
jgi:hypothetical protein